MKLAIMTAVGLALAATVVSTPVEAGQFGGLGKKMKEIKREAKKVERSTEDIVDTVEAVDAVANGRAPASCSSSSNHPARSRNGGCPPTRFPLAQPAERPFALQQRADKLRMVVPLTGPEILV